MACGMCVELSKSMISGTFLYPLARGRVGRSSGRGGQFVLETIVAGDPDWPSPR